MATEQPNYHAYLLRLWRTDLNPTRISVWRASLEDPHTVERLGIATPEHLFAYLVAVSEGGEGATATDPEAYKRHLPTD